MCVEMLSCHDHMTNGFRRVDNDVENEKRVGHPSPSKTDYNITKIIDIM